MTFENLVELVKIQFNEMQSQGELYVSSIDGHQIWNTYLSKFEEKKIFRDPNSSEHHCNHCSNFIRRYGNIVAIRDNKIITMFDIAEKYNLGEYHNSIESCMTLLKNNPVSNFFIESFEELKSLPYEKTDRNQTTFRLGVANNQKVYNTEEVNKFGVVKEGQVYTFNHFHCDLNREYVHFGASSLAAVKGTDKENFQLFKKTLGIPLDTLQLVRDLIQQGSLLRGDMYLSKVLDTIQIKEEYDKLTLSAFEKELWIWSVLPKVKVPRFANELIGTLCIELAEGKELNAACLDYNKRADPTNYAQAKSPVTPKMIQEAEKQIEELGFTESFNRKFATEVDISEILHSNVDNFENKPVGLFAKAGVNLNTVGSRHKRSEFDKVEEVSIDKFINTILPTATQIEVYLENRLESNFVALHTQQKSSKLLFKWDNPFGWTYKNNLSGISQIKEEVSKAGGKVTGVLRASLMWNDTETKGLVDFDLHCESHYGHIYYGNKQDLSGGKLDVDMINPTSIGVENITWQKNLKDGRYQFSVNTFSTYNNTGFKVEIEFDGEVYNYHYKTSTNNKQIVYVATVTVKDGVMSIEHHLPEIGNNSSKQIWNLNTNQFHKVSLMCHSPNYWGNNSVGTKEYFFMLQDCTPDIPLKGFHTDHLCNELTNIRKSIGLLGNYKMITPQKGVPILAGVGFNSTVRNELIVKVSGSHKRVLKIKF